VPSAGGKRSYPLSFPRRRESNPKTIRNVLTASWIPAFAGMTQGAKGAKV